MLEIIVLSLFFFVSNFYTVNIPVPDDGIFNSISGLIKKDNNKYILVNNQFYSCYIHKLEMEYDNITFLDKRYFSGNHGNHDDTMEAFWVIDNNIIIYSFMFHAFVENNGKTNDIIWGNIHWGTKKRYLTETSSYDCLLICTWTHNFSLNSAVHIDDRYDFQLNLIKAPYTEISKEIEIETLAKDGNLELIGLKDYFLYIKIDDDKKGKKNITYKFLDFDLNLVNSLTKKYENYSEMYFYSLPKDDEINKFIMCILKNEDVLKYLKIYKCQIIKYENEDLQIIQTIDIPITITHPNAVYYSTIRFFDENKIAFYFYGIIGSYSGLDYINILQYENQVLSFYKNFKNLTIPHLV